MLGGVDPWEGEGIGGVLGDPDNKRNTWKSVLQGLERSEGIYQEEKTGEEIERDIPYATSTGTGFDRGYDPRKDTFKKRQSVREKEGFEQEVW
ncbi:MAG: hypothetical protein SVS85_03895 [Candidatus Nanohaloarchaea archaeon]|nr:hypothetical protein [Candidatus Nanohaloarchaea archaeon]